MNSGGRWAVLVSWMVIAAVTVGVSLDTDLRWRYLLDMHVYIQGAEHFWRGTDLYGTFFPTRNEGLPFTYPPFGAVVFTPLWLLTEAIGQTATERVFTLVSVAMVWLVARTLTQAVPTDGRPARMAVILVVLICSLPVLSTLDLGQINTVLLALVILDVGRLFPRVPLGLLTGVAAAIKLTPLVFGLYFLIVWIMRRKPAGLIGMGVGFLGATSLTWMINPGVSVTYWTQTLFSSDRIGEPWYAKNVSIRGLLARFPDLEITPVLWGVSVIIVITMVSVAVIRVLHSGDTRLHHLLAVSLVALISLLCSPVSWHHHWVWLGPLAICLWFTGHRFLAGWAVFAQTIGAFHMFLPSSGGTEFSWSPIAHLLATHYLWFSLLVVVHLMIRPTIGPGDAPVAGPARGTRRPDRCRGVTPPEDRGD
ncbi:hypothetical protein HMPREF0290_2106 [Corynebacterium efficiens YS-314]|nr:hypothetical protein HMPREF0290_2106 [Corynebacterium efficiens YS-314]